MEQHNCDFLCTNKATRRFGKLFICESCARPPEHQCGTSISDYDRSERISHRRPENGSPAQNEGVIPTEIPLRRLYSSEDLADARRFLSNLRPRTSWDGDEEEFMANAADRLYDVKFVGRFAQRVDWAIATYYARVEKANRLAQQRASRHNS
jgi:hypothetical protein